MAQATVSDEQVAQFADFTSLDVSIERDLITNALRSWNGDLERATSEFWEVGEANFRSKHTWEEGLWSSGRDGVADQPQTPLPSFNINAPDDAGGVIQGVSPSALHHVAPSRPPSRAQAPLGRLIDWTTEETGMSGNKTQEDVNLERAIAQSLADSQGISDVQSPQETGVVAHDTSNVAFGPANRDEYPAAEWGMVVAHHRNPEPGPSLRKRAPGSPAFLRCRSPGWDQNKVSGIVTLLHSVPAARNALLSTRSAAASLGNNGEWWKGTAIEAPLSEDDNPNWEPFPEVDLADELHRLMAFLDSTDRSYGTADVVIRTTQVEGARDASTSTGDWEKFFFNALKDATTDEGRQTLFTRVEMRHLHGGDTSPEESAFAILDMYLTQAQAEQAESLYAVLDSIFWSELDYDEEVARVVPPRLAVISSPGDVLLLRHEGTALHPNMEIPATLYLDRYMAENKDAAVELQLQLRTVYHALKKADVFRAKLTNWVHPETGRIFDQRELSRAIIAKRRRAVWHLKADAVWRRHEELWPTADRFDFVIADVEKRINDGSVMMTAEEEQTARYHEAWAVSHEKKLARIDRTLNRLKAEEEACLTLLHSLRRRLTGPSEKDGWEPKHVYTLRGIVTSSDVIYLHRPSQENLIELEGMDEAQEEWWKLAYDETADQPIQVERSSMEAALRAARSGDQTHPVFVYASEKAMRAEPTPLTPAQRTFVKHDNRLFRQELLEEKPAPRDRKRASSEALGPDSGGEGGLPAASPPKRHQRAGSLDSIATNRASMGDVSDRGDFADDDMMVDAEQGYAPQAAPQPAAVEDEGFHEHESDGGVGTEMVQLAISQPLVADSVTSEHVAVTTRPDGYIADWDHPEGKPVRAQTPRAHFYE